MEMAILISLGLLVIIFLVGWIIIKVSDWFEEK